ncbi:hypothetical protein [Bradyrhizobium sp. USDA 4529]
MDGKVGFDDDGVGPYQVHQLALTYEFTCSFHEWYQEFEGTASQSDGLFAVEQLALGNMQAESSKRSHASRTQ